MLYNIIAAGDNAISVDYFLTILLYYYYRVYYIISKNVCNYLSTRRKQYKFLIIFVETHRDCARVEKKKK